MRQSDKEEMTEGRKSKRQCQGEKAIEGRRVILPDKQGWRRDVCLAE